MAVREDTEKSKSTRGSSPRGNRAVESAQSESEYEGDLSTSDGGSDSGSSYNGE